jgi:nucleotide-binding universal stress UspA family protein
MIPQIQKILYTTDLTKNSAYAFRYATKMAEKYGAEIIILHVVEPIPPMAKHYMKIYVDETKWEEKIKYEQDLAIERIQKRLQEFCRLETEDTPQCHTQVENILVRPGYPVEEILKAADEEDCSMIVLGTHGKGLLKQTFLGSVARSVLDRAKRPIFIVPLPYGEVEGTIGEI